MLSHEGSWRDLQGRDGLRDLPECGIVLKYSVLPSAHTKKVVVEGKDELDATSCYKALLSIKREHRALAAIFKCKVLITVQY